MGYIWVNSTTNTVPGVSPGPVIPEWLQAVILLVLLAAGTYALLYAILKAIIAYHEWFAGLIADRVVQKMEKKTKKAGDT